ncbi:two-component sensor histidine kinase [Novosphingobium sp. PC22D]|nr:HAMP domain-containing sensor histidine kinase [Novosphingobium sp. PC22D]PEQ14056.1 two-component sensor histidine kinase [Novosphingobium sp. PC22D]
MMRRSSISRQLTQGLALVGLVGTLLLFLFVAIEYGMTFSTFFDREALPRVIHELSEHVLMPVLVLIVPMTLAARWVIRRSLAPLADAAERVDAAPEMARGFRIETGQLPLEAVPFADSVNALLARLDRAAGDQEAFAADVAHELRTPLTLLALEMDRLDPDTAAPLRRDIAHMRRLVDQLMLLAQIDADNAAQMPQTPIDLAELAADVAGRLAPLAVSQDRLIAVEGKAAQCVRGRREALAAALRNLIENALRVTPAGGTVTLRVGPDATIAVCDEGEGLSREQLDQLVRRHRRGDHASVDGAGLGLAIVARIMAAHGGSVTAEPEHRVVRLQFAPDTK